MHLIVLQSPVRVSSSFATSLTISWSLPRYTYGSISAYNVECSSTGVLTRQITVQGYQFDAQVAGLHPFTSYQCCVSATNSAGTGTASCTMARTEEAGIE